MAVVCGLSSAGVPTVAWTVSSPANAKVATAPMSSARSWVVARLGLGWTR